MKFYVLNGFALTSAGLLVLFLPLTTLAQKDTGLDNSTFDNAIRVQDDLYQAVNGTWLKNTEIPPDKSNYGSFTILSDLSQERTRAIIEEAAAGTHAKGSNSQKVGDYYKSYMNEERIEQLGYSPLKPELKRIRELSSISQLIEYFGHAQSLGIDTPIGFFVGQDDKNSTQYLTSLIQSGTSLPDRDYYLEDDEKYIAARDALQQYITRVFELIETPTGAAAKQIVHLEKKLAALHWERTELRDANKRYNKYVVEDLPELTPNIDWPSFFARASVQDVSEVNVMTPSFFAGLDKVMTQTPLPIWKRYLEFHLVDTFAPVLSKDFVDEHFKLHSEHLAGIPQQQPRWKRAVDSTAGRRGFGVLGGVVGKLYVEKHFPADAKARMDQLVKNLLAAFGQSIDELTWMTDTTKEEAQKKLGKITTKIGYPDTWRDYDQLTIDADDLFGNVIRSAAVEYARMTDKLGRPVDRDEWHMTPHTVNAYYNPGLNEIVFPAAILQPPFFNTEADDAVNYGAIGAVIGHEISHAFDDQGSKYDGDGNLNNWWTDEDRAAFKKLTSQLVAQYAEYEPLPRKNVNGELTLGENIADLSGLSIAYKAYKISLAGKPSPEILGWSGDQRFFLGWSQVWRRKYRDAEMMRRLLTDPHSPSWYRANGPVINIDAFYDAFHVKTTDKMFKPKEERIKIW